MEKVVTPEGKVAITYYQPIPKLVRVGNTQVYFDCQYGISLALVDESLVPSLLGVLGGCCGGKRQIIHLASQVQYDHWKFGKGGR